MEKSNYFLLIDDNKALTFLNKVTLERLGLGHDIKTAENGDDALQLILENGNPELIFLDLNMPVTDGWEFLASYKKIDPSMSKSTIILTTAVSLDNKQRKMAETRYNITHFCDKIIHKDYVSTLVNDTLCKA